MKNLLVIDDFASVRFYHRSLLERSGHRVLTAPDGAAALELINRESVDLVMLDLMMPVMDGAEFVRHIRAMPRYHLLPVVVVTSEVDHPRLQELRADPACTLLSKPVLPEALLAALRSRFG